MVNVQDHNIVMKGIANGFPPPFQINSFTHPLGERPVAFYCLPFTLLRVAFLNSKRLTREFKGRTCRISISLDVTQNKYRSKTSRWDYDRHVSEGKSTSIRPAFILLLFAKKSSNVKVEKTKKEMLPKRKCVPLFGSTSYHLICFGQGSPGLAGS